MCLGFCSKLSKLFTVFFRKDSDIIVLMQSATHCNFVDFFTHFGTLRQRICMLHDAHGIGLAVKNTYQVDYCCLTHDESKRISLSF